MRPCHYLKNYSLYLILAHIYFISNTISPYLYTQLRFKRHYLDVGVIFLNYADLVFQTSMFTADNNIWLSRYQLIHLFILKRYPLELLLNITSSKKVFFLEYLACAKYAVNS